MTAAGDEPGGVLEPMWIQTPVKITCVRCGWHGTGRDAPAHLCVKPAGAEGERDRYLALRAQGTSQWEAFYEVAPERAAETCLRWERWFRAELGLPARQPDPHYVHRRR